MIEIGQVTPPVGLIYQYWYLSQKKKVLLGEVAIATMPYWLILLAGILLLTAIPQIALFLPSKLM